MLRSKLTHRSQTTLPSGVRKALELTPGSDSIEWEIRGDVALARRAAPQAGQDPALIPFLDLLRRDIAEHPERIRGLPHGLYERIQAVTEGIDGSVDDAIEGPVAL